MESNLIAFLPFSVKLNGTGIFPLYLLKGTSKNSFPSHEDLVGQAFQPVYTGWKARATSFWNQEKIPQFAFLEVPIIDRFVTVA